MFILLCGKICLGRSHPFSDSYDSVPHLLYPYNMNYMQEQDLVRDCGAKIYQQSHRMDIVSSDKAHNIHIARVQLLGGTEA